MDFTYKLTNYNLYNGLHNTFVIGMMESYLNENNLCQVAIEYCESYDVDGLILLDLYNKKENAIFNMIFYNRDGSRGPMCGNGIRCLMRFAYDNNIVKENIEYNVDTLSGIRKCKITSINPFIVYANLGIPYFDPNIIEINSDKEFINEEFIIDNYKLNLTCIFLATHHCVAVVKDNEEIEYIIRNNIAFKLKEHPFFKKGVNANFTYVIDKDNIFVRTCERGVGWTKACGTGASSSFKVLNMLGKINDKVTVHFIDGSVEVSKNESGEIILEGLASLGK